MVVYAAQTFMSQFEKVFNGCGANMTLGCGNNSMFLSMMPASFIIKRFCAKK